MSEPKITDAELKAIRERAAKATPGPWRTEAGEPYVLNIDVDASLPGASLRVVDERRVSRIGIIPHGILFAPDAEFVAHAREDVPALCAEVERLRRLLGEQTTREQQVLPEGE